MNAPQPKPPRRPRASCAPARVPMFPKGWGTILDRASGTLLSWGMLSGSAFLKACFSVTVLAAATLGGCGGGSGADCVSLCQAAQAGKCTSISGDCGKFCAAVEVVAPEA